MRSTCWRYTDLAKGRESMVTGALITPVFAKPPPAADASPVSLATEPANTGGLRNRSRRRYWRCRRPPLGPPRCD
jgi:hypothetical protein